MAGITPVCELLEGRELARQYQLGTIQLIDYREGRKGSKGGAFRMTGMLPFFVAKDR